MLPPQQVKDYLGKDAAPLPDGTPMPLHERAFNKAAASRLSMTDAALRRIDLSSQHPRHLLWPLSIYHPDKLSIGNYLRQPVTYTVGPAINVVLWAGEGVVTGLVGTAQLVYILIEQQNKGEGGMRSEVSSKARFARGKKMQRNALALALS